MAHICKEGALGPVSLFGIFTGGFCLDSRIICFLQCIREGSSAICDRGFKPVVKLFQTLFAGLDLSSHVDKAMREEAKVIFSASGFR